MNILVIAPHPDDEILGVGGTIARKKDEGHDVFVCVVTRGQMPLFSDEAVALARSETITCHHFLGIQKTFFLDFPAVMLETTPRHELNGKIFEVIQEVMPEEVYIPHAGDMQRDHQIVSEAAMVALRPKNRHTVRHIYTYETLSETGWNIPNVQNQFIPNVYVDISSFLGQKLKAMSIYKSQLGEFPEARSLQAIEALAKYRGATVNVCAAEAFSLVREIL